MVMSRKPSGKMPFGTHYNAYLNSHLPALIAAKTQCLAPSEGPRTPHGTAYSPDMIADAVEALHIATERTPPCPSEQLPSD